MFLPLFEIFFLYISTAPNCRENKINYIRSSSSTIYCTYCTWINTQCKTKEEIWEIKGNTTLCTYFCNNPTYSNFRKATLFSSWFSVLYKSLWQICNPSVLRVEFYNKCSCFSPPFKNKYCKYLHKQLQLHSGTQYNPKTQIKWFSINGWVCNYIIDHTMTGDLIWMKVLDVSVPQSVRWLCCRHGYHWTTSLHFLLSAETQVDNPVHIKVVP